MPRTAQIIDLVRRRSAAKIFFHTCGAVYDFLPDLIEIGVHILNPVQVSANGMEPERLKRTFGADLAFWGGMDTQKVLPFGTRHEIRDEVKRLVEALAPGGGFIFAAVHNIQSGTPPENVVAMIEAF